MSNEIQHENGGYEHQDLQASSVLYFLLVLAVVTVICLFGIKGLYLYLDAREKAEQPAVNPLVTNVPTDTRHIEREYPQSAFPSPRLEQFEGVELDQDLVGEENTLYSYGWVDEKAGTVHIPIERAMDLLVQRGLPVRLQGAADGVTSAKAKTGGMDRNRTDRKRMDQKK